MPKKLHVITKYFYPVVAGIELNIFETYKRLDPEKWEIVIHTSKDTYLKKNCLPKDEVIGPLQVKRYPFKWFGFFPDLDWNDDCVIALHNFDIFPHVFFMLYTLWLKVLGKKRFRLFLTPHGGFNPEWKIYSKFRALIKKTYTYTLGSLLINLTVDGIRAVSDWEKNEMLSRGLDPKKIQTISNGLEDAAFNSDDTDVTSKTKKLVKSWGRYIFEDARIYSIKNQETIIKALPSIPKDIKLVNIGTVGDSKYLNDLKDLASRLGVSDRVIFPGVIMGADKYYINRHALAFVHMAKWESFCNVVHQAISQGLVCIVANNTALPYLVKDKINGFLVETFDHVALANKINFILDPKNKKAIKTIQRYNLDHGRENSWANVARKMETLYSSGPTPTSNSPALHPVLSRPWVKVLVDAFRKIQRPVARWFKPRKNYFLFPTPKRNIKPISISYGFDRGVPVDRYYIEKFLALNKKDIKGNCLEITDDAYIKKFGGSKVSRGDILDINRGNKQATIYADLQNMPQIGDNTYDCVILTQTLLMIPDYEAAIRECKRILKPGGVLLVTVSSLSPVWNIASNMWRFTKASAEYIFNKYFSPDNLTVETFGNALAGQAFWVGMAIQDLAPEELEDNDPYFPVTVAVRAVKNI